MAWAAAAIIVGSLISSDAQSTAAAKARKAAKRAGDKGSVLEAGQYNITQEQLAPQREAGGLALQEQMYLLGLSPNLDVSATRTTPHLNDDGTYTNEGGGQPGQGGADGTYTNEGGGQPGQGGAVKHAGGYGSLMDAYTPETFFHDPSYEFTKGEALKGLSAQEAASGHTMSGGALKDAMKYAEGLASTEFGNAYNRSVNEKTRQWNMLSGISGIGERSTNTGINQGNQTTQGMTNILSGVTGAQIGAIGAQGQANANIGNAISGIGMGYATGQYKLPSGNDTPVQQPTPVIYSA